MFYLLKIMLWDLEFLNIDYVCILGGLFMDMLIYDFDMVRYIMGNEVMEVYVKGVVLVNFFFVELGDIDMVVIILIFENGVMVVIDNSC